MSGFRKDAAGSQGGWRNLDCQRWSGCFAVCQGMWLLRKAEFAGLAVAGEGLTFLFHIRKASGCLMKDLDTMRRKVSVTLNEN